MTVAAVEAAPAAVDAAAAPAATRPLPAPRRSRSRSPARKSRPTRTPRSAPVRSASPAVAPPADRPQTGRTVDPSTFKVGGSAPSKNYQPVILAEFVAAILLTAATPIATKKDTQGLSPYAGADMIKLASLTAVYLVLALISTGGSEAGRYSAWFGGLILLAVGMVEAVNLSKILTIFGGVTTTPAKAAPKTEPHTG